MTMMRALSACGLLAMLVACTPADEQYCQRFGVGGTTEFAKCLDYFHAQEAAFGADRDRCELEADFTYPRTLYDTGRTVHFIGGAYGGRYYGGGTEFIEPDYYHNMQVDALRSRIVGPCMLAAGWNSPNSWQAGQHPVAPRPLRKPMNLPPEARPVSPLPWLQ